MEVNLEAAGLKELVECLEQSPEVMRLAKRQAFHATAPKLKAAVDAQIGGSGKVQSWQGAYVGTKGGYAATRPRAKTYAEDSKGRKTKYAVGYVTNAINSGHRFPSSKLGYRSRVGVVPGKKFYEHAQTQAERVAQEAVEQVVGALVDHLEG